MHRIIFQAGPFTVHTYGVFVGLGIALSVILISREARGRGFLLQDILDILMLVLAGGILGGRALFVMINWRHYAEGPLWSVVNVAEGGLAVQGAIAGGIFAGAMAARFKKMSFFRVSDLIAPYVALAQAVGRIGCFLNGCCYGKVTASEWGVIFPGENVTRIPSQLYSSLGLLLVFLVLRALGEKKRFNGYVFCWYLILYSALRFFMDFLRGDDLAVFAGMTLSQSISLLTALCGSLLYFVLGKAGNSRGGG